MCGGEKHKVVFRGWHQNWERSANFFIQLALREVIYTIGPIESYRWMVRNEAAKAKGAFSIEDAIIKQNYLAMTSVRAEWRGTIRGWLM